MSILVKPYEISIWEDVWQGGALFEKKKGVIGSNLMTSLNRVLEPTLTRNVNGVKTLSFKLQARYVEPFSGKEVVNPFVDWLVAEQKVKLKYGTYIDESGQEKDCWYDFVVKSINENSSNYVYSYTLEDALVQELSKNGFGIVLDAELQNNMGNAKDLAEYVLSETDWQVDSDTIVQTVDESLVYLSTPININDYKIYHIIDPKQPNEGIQTELLKTENLYVSGK